MKMFVITSASSDNGYGKPLAVANTKEEIEFFVVRDFKTVFPEAGMSKINMYRESDKMILIEVEASPNEKDEHGGYAQDYEVFKVNLVSNDIRDTDIDSFFVI